MKKTFYVFMFSLMPVIALASGGTELMKSPHDLKDTESLKRGAKLFVDYCLHCHSAKYMRYQRMGDDLGISEDELKANYMTLTDKPGNTMTVAMRPEDAERWFGVAPPDLSVISRARGTDWLYTYLLSFYADPSKPMGINNLVFPDVGMPHVLWNLEGGLSKAVTKEDEKGHKVVDHLEPADEAKHEMYKQKVADLVNFLDYMGEPIKLQRQALGVWVIGFLVILAIFSYILKREYWRDIK
jgi:ubiquinol-cytochrome c reductase cytochrome c1 subunit